MRSLALLIALSLTVTAQAQDLADTCHASSSYDLTVAPDRLRFDRVTPAPRRIELHDGRASVDGTPLRLGAADSDRLALFEHDLRALLPRARAVARDGVDLAVKILREEGAALHLGSEARRQYEAILAMRTAELKRRIDASTSTRDWQEDALQRWADDVAAELAQPVAADLGAQALAAAATGDLAAAAELRDRAADLAGNLRPRIERRMQALRPRIAELCPAIRQLHELQDGVRGADGRPLALLEIAAAR